MGCGVCVFQLANVLSRIFDKLNGAYVHLYHIGVLIWRLQESTSFLSSLRTSHMSSFPHHAFLYFLLIGLLLYESNNYMNQTCLLLKMK